MNLTLPLLLAILFAGLATTAHAGETIAIIDFDKNPAKYQFSYAFGGYGSADGTESISISEQLSSAHSLDAKAGRTTESATEKNACGKAVLDATKAKVPFDASYEYAGVGSGASYDLTGKKFGKLDPEACTVSFDAKVSGATSLSQSKLMLNFVKADGDDDNDHEDIVVRMVRGQDDGTGTFELGTEWKTIRYSLSELDLAEGTLAALAEAELTGINFTVQAQGDFADFGADKDNVLLIDNLRIEKKYGGHANRVQCAKVVPCEAKLFSSSFPRVLKVSPLRGITRFAGDP